MYHRLKLGSLSFRLYFTMMYLLANQAKAHLNISSLGQAPTLFAIIGLALKNFPETYTLAYLGELRKCFITLPAKKSFGGDEKKWCHNTQHKDTQNNGIQQNNSLSATLSVMRPSTMAEHCNAEYYLY